MVLGSRNSRALARDLSQIDCAGAWTAPSSFVRFRKRPLDRLTPFGSQRLRVEAIRRAVAVRCGGAYRMIGR